MIAGLSWVSVVARRRDAGRPATARKTSAKK
jgi:hypothetical protein